jgi:hypothetical protein
LQSPPRHDVLADKPYVTVILRLLLGHHGRLEHGEVVDVDGNAQGRFKDWNGLTRKLRRWLATREPDAEDGG